jgi:hypothetical protein
MQPNATAYVCVTYQSQWQADPSKFLQGQPPYNDTFDFSLGVSIEHCFSGPQNSFGCSSTASHSFTVQAYPSSIQPAASMNYVSVLYVFTALANSTGFYDNSVPFQYCDGMPMAVGYAADLVNGSDFAPRLVHSCIFSLFTPKSVSVVGMDFLNIPVDKFPRAPNVIG